MLDRFFLYAANAVTIVFGLAAFLFLISGLIQALDGQAAIGDFVAAGALIVVPYCFAGTLHRIVGIGEPPKS